MSAKQIENILHELKPNEKNTLKKWNETKILFSERTSFVIFFGTSWVDLTIQSNND